MEVTDFFGEKVIFDKDGGYIFAMKNERLQMIAEVRGWGAIQNLFKGKSGIIDGATAAIFQDELGKYIADAINEKLERKTSLLAGFPENSPLYKDSGLWQMRSDNMEEVIIQQGVNESENDFISRCKANKK